MNSLLQGSYKTSLQGYWKVLDGIQAWVVLGQGLAALVHFKLKVSRICALGRPSGTAIYPVLWSRGEKQGPKALWSLASFSKSSPSQCFSDTLALSPLVTENSGQNIRGLGAKIFITGHIFKSQLKNKFIFNCS